MNYAREIPIDKRNNTYSSTPAFTSNQSQMGVPLASSVLTLNDNSTVLNVTVIGGQAGNAAIVGKWGSASVTSSNFDFVVNSGDTRTFVIPVSVAGVYSVAGANVANGLYQTVALKNATGQSASVLTVEY